MRWLIVVGIAVLVGGGAWFALQGGGDDPVPPAKLGSSDPRAPETAAIYAPVAPTLGSGSGQPERMANPPANPVASTGSTPTPALPTEGSGSGGPRDPSQRFASQPRDPQWAAATEREIKRRVGAIRGARLDAAECRQDVCLLSISGTEDQLSTTLGGLETSRGLHGFASSVLLTGPESDAAGNRTIKVYASFTR
jgi:hypothetical protein